MEINGIVVVTIVPWVIRVIRDRVTDVVDGDTTIWNSWEAAFLDAATVIFDKNTVIAVFMERNLTIACIRDVVIAPHCWLWLTAIAAIGTAWVEYENVAGIWVWSLYITETVEIDKATNLATRDNILATLTIVDKTCR